MKTAYEILKEAELMSREVIAAEVNGEVIGLSEPVAEGSEVKAITFSDKEGKKEHIKCHDHQENVVPNECGKCIHLLQ